MCFLFVLTLLLLCDPCYAALSSGYNFALEFPDGDSLSTSNYVMMEGVQFPTSAATVCTWMRKFQDPRTQHIWFSYAVPSMDNAYMLSDYFHNAVSNSYMEWTDLVLLKDVWYHFCLSWSGADRLMSFYVNGVLVRTHPTGSEVRTGGTLVLGQDQDTMGGSFDINQAFAGQLYDLNVFTRALRVEEIVAMYYDGRCTRSLASTLVHDLALSWEEILGGTKSGAVKKVDAGCQGNGFLAQITELVLKEIAATSQR